MEKAEAILLALGPSLTWRVIAPGLPHVFAVVAPTRVDTIRTRYRCDERSTGPGFQAMVMFNSLADSSQKSYEICPRFFATLDAAKAACERHFATGKWE